MTRFFQRQTSNSNGSGDSHRPCCWVLPSRSPVAPPTAVSSRRRAHPARACLRPAACRHPAAHRAAPLRRRARARTRDRAQAHLRHPGPPARAVRAAPALPVRVVPAPVSQVLPPGGTSMPNTVPGMPMPNGSPGSTPGGNTPGQESGQQSGQQPGQGQNGQNPGEQSGSSEGDGDGTLNQPTWTPPQEAHLAATHYPARGTGRRAIGQPVRRPASWQRAGRSTRRSRGHRSAWRGGLLGNRRTRQCRGRLGDQQSAAQRQFEHTANALRTRPASGIRRRQ